MDDFNKLLIYRNKLVTPYIEKLIGFLDVLSCAFSLLFLLTLVYEHGFVLSDGEAGVISAIYNWVWVVYLIDITLKLILSYERVKKRYKGLTWIVSSMLYLTLIPVIFIEPNESDGVYGVWMFLDSIGYHLVLFTILSVLKLSTAILTLLGKRANPSVIFSASFFFFIMIGAGLLMLPRSTYDGISFIDALFIATSATCVTGLSTVDVAATFTPTGLFFIMMLIQIGGLGVMTLTSFFAVFFMGNASLHKQVMMCDMVSSKSLNTLFTTLLYILGFTLIIETIGAAIIFWNIHDTLDMSLNDEIAFSVFHAISAFCNAGFSTMPNNLGNPMLMSGHNIFYIVIAFLVVLGGIGFPILVNLYETVKYHLGRLKQRYVYSSKERMVKPHMYDLNTRIVLISTIILLSVATIAIAALEWNNSLWGMPTLDKIVHSFFAATSPRTAGFNSVAISSFSIQTILLFTVLMVIGGGTQSTAGGVKINVFAVVMINLRAIVCGLDKATILNREISTDSIRRSNSTLMLYMIFIMLSLFALTAFEPEASLLALLFEAISALSTVGASLDITSSLGTDSKVVVIMLMFVGRVGVLTMMTSIIKQQKKRKYGYPKGNIIIN